MEIFIKGDPRDNSGEKWEGTMFDIQEDAVWIYVGNQYVRVDKEEFVRLLKVFS